MLRNPTLEISTALSQMAATPRGTLFFVPDDIVFEILTRLPIESITRFKTVCNEWHHITKDPLFIMLHLSRSNVHPHKLLLIQNAKPVMGCFLAETSEFKPRKLIDINADDFENPRIMCSFNGLICIASSTCLNPLKICNPITNEFLELPDSDFTDRVNNHRVALGYDKSTKRYRVVRSYKKWSDRVSDPSKVETLTLGEPFWKKLSNGNPFYHEKHGPVFCDGAFYWINGLANGFDNQIIQLDVNSEEFHYIKPPLHRLLQYVLSNTSLLNLEGHLVLAIDDFRNVYIIGMDNELLSYFNKDKLKANGIEGALSSRVYVALSSRVYVDLVSMPSRDSYILGITRMPYLRRRTKLLVKYHSRSIEILPFCYDGFNAMSFKPSLLSPSMAMSSGTG